MFSKRRFRRRNKPRSQNFLEGGEQQQEAPFIPPVQTKLNIGKPGDAYEVEADKTADAVVAKTDTTDSIQKMGAEEEEVQAKPLAQGLTPFVQKQEAPEEEEPVQAMAEKEEEEPVQMQEEEEEEPVQAQVEEEEEPVQAQAAEEEELRAKGNHIGSADTQFEQQLKQQQGQGNKLDLKDRVPLEEAFGADFSSVNIHTDGKANTLNKQINARAFTHGADIYFKNGTFNPSSKEGKHLLAHELTHTIQQGALDSGKTTGNRKTSGKIQREPIDYRALTWDDFKGPVDEASKKSASTAYAIKFDPRPGFINAQPSWDGSSTATVTISYNPSLVIMKGIFETDESWKKAWLTDDEAAAREFGPDGNFENRRTTLLAHEQIHFKIADTMAKSYLIEIREAIPKDPYTETGPAESAEAVEIFAESVLNKKADEIHNAFGAIKAKADITVKAVQDIYDLGTVHSKKIKKQEKWQDQFDVMLKAAIAKAKADIAAQQPGAPHDN